MQSNFVCILTHIFRLNTFKLLFFFIVKSRFGPVVVKVIIFFKCRNQITYVNEGGIYLTTEELLYVLNKIARFVIPLYRDGEGLKIHKMLSHF